MNAGHLHTAAEPRSVNVAEGTRRLVIVVVGAAVGIIGALASSSKGNHSGVAPHDVFGFRGQQAQHGPQVIMECRNSWWQDKLDCTPVHIPPAAGGRR
jgi:hypothetical protein